MKKILTEIDPEDLAWKFVKNYRKYGACICIPDWEEKPDRPIFRVKLKRNTRKKQLTDQLVVLDLAECPHLLFGGATNSGKTVGLQLLSTSIIFCKPYGQINLILIDVGATKLMPFEGIPHLSCLVITDSKSTYHALILLKTEREESSDIERTFTTW